MTEQLDLRGKIALVTGGNTGIGLATVRSLASRGAKVYMACRSGARSRAAIERLHEENPGLSADQVLWLPLDLGDPGSVARLTMAVCHVGHFALTLGLLPLLSKATVGLGPLEGI